MSSTDRGIEQGLAGDAAGPPVLVHGRIAAGDAEILVERSPPAVRRSSSLVRIGDLAVPFLGIIEPGNGIDVDRGGRQRSASVSRVRRRSASRSRQNRLDLVARAWVAGAGYSAFGHDSSPQASPSARARSRSTNFCTLPVEVLGRSQNTTVLGALKWARLSRQNAIMSASVAFSSFLQGDESAGRLAPFVVRARGDRGFEHGGVAVEHTPRPRCSICSRPLR